MKSIKKYSLVSVMTILTTSMLLLLFPATQVLATISTGVTDLTTLLKTPSQCEESQLDLCPSGAYLVTASDGAQTLYRLGTYIGGYQNGSTHEGAAYYQWTNHRYAILIDAGTYDMLNEAATPWPEPFRIAYYEEVLGIAPDRSEVTISPGINMLNNCTTVPGSCYTNGGLTNYWRGLSNLTLNTNPLLNPDNTAEQPGGIPNEATDLRFAISQSSFVRNVHFTGDKRLQLCDWNTAEALSCGPVRGGFIGNSAIDQKLSNGTQQNIYITNSSFQEWIASYWNPTSSPLPSAAYNLVSHNNLGNLTSTFFVPINESIGNIWLSTPPFPFTQIDDQAFTTRAEQYEK